MLTTPSDRVTEVSSVYPANTLEILVTSEGMTRSVTRVPLRYNLPATTSGFAVSYPKLILHHADRSVISTPVSPEQ